MITFDSLREYMDRNGISVYSLKRDKIIGGATVDKLRNNSPGVTVATIDALCNYLGCKPSDIITYVPDDKAPGD